MLELWRLVVELAVILEPIIVILVSFVIMIGVILGRKKFYRAKTKKENRAAKKWSNYCHYLTLTLIFFNIVYSMSNALSQEDNISVLMIAYTAGYLVIIDQCNSHYAEQAELNERRK